MRFSAGSTRPKQLKGVNQMRRFGWAWLAVIIVTGLGVEASAVDTNDANTFEVAALIRQRDRRVAEITLSYAGEIGQFAGTFPIPGPGPYDITVYAFDPRNGNTGLDRATVVVAETAAQTDEE
jgi:hypothetical protein